MEIDRVKKYKYLGITQADSGLKKAKRKKATNARQRWGTQANLRRYRANKYVMIKGVMKGVTVPCVIFR